MLAPPSLGGPQPRVLSCWGGGGTKVSSELLECLTLILAEGLLKLKSYSCRPIQLFLFELHMCTHTFWFLRFISLSTKGLFRQNLHGTET